MRTFILTAWLPSGQPDPDVSIQIITPDGDMTARQISLNWAADDYMYVLMLAIQNRWKVNNCHGWREVYSSPKSIGDGPGVYSVFEFDFDTPADEVYTSL